MFDRVCRSMRMVGRGLLGYFKDFTRAIGLAYAFMYKSRL